MSRPCVCVTQLSQMSRRLPNLVTAALLAGLTLFAQNPAASDDEYAIYTDAPRLLLTKARLRLLQRERERKSMRWEQFDALVGGGAPMPEPGFAQALYYQVAGDAAVGKKAVDWALSDQAKPEQDRDLRQLALVFDWCSPLMTPQQSERLVTKIRRGITPPPAAFGKQPALVMAAIAIADALPDHGASTVKSIVEDWKKNIAGKLENGQPLVA